MHPCFAAALGLPDYTVLAVYLAASVLIGTLVGRRHGSLDEYCLADRRIPWWAACVSIVASDLSGVSYMGMPAWVYQKDLKYAVGIVMMPAVMLAIALYFVPVFYRAGVYTVYEYLERRFHSSARTLTAILFLFKRGAWLAGALYIPSFALTTGTDLPLAACILIIGTATTLYTMHGGMRAVIWTDLMQFIVLTGGLLLMIGAALSALHWDLAGVWAAAGPHTRMADFTPDLKTEATVWALVVFYFIYNVGAYGTDQLTVQRYFTVKSFRELLKSVMGSALLNIAAVFLLAYLGIVLVAYYQARPDLAEHLDRPDRIVPHFVMTALPAGARGVIFAAIFAATMSVASSALNSFSTVGVVDLYRKRFPDRPEAHYVRMAQVFTVLSGALAMGAALWVSRRQTTILETIASLESKFVGPIVGMFFLGVFTRRANLFGVVVGMLAGVGVGFAMDWQPVADRVNWMWTAPFACLATFVVGYLASFGAQAPVRAPQPEPAAPEVIA